MTASEFETVRADLAAFRLEVASELATLRAELANKPSLATMYQASLGIFAGMFAVIVGTVILLKTVGVIP